MNYFRILFSGNKIVSCTKTVYPPPNGKVYYEHENGEMLYAIVAADTKKDAENMVIEYVKKMENIRIENKPEKK